MQMCAFACAALTTLVLCAAAPEARADDPPAEHALPEPQKEHEWLRQLTGEWDTEGEVVMDPTQPPVKTTGRESSRMIGGFWAVFEHTGEAMGTPFTGILTVGYDPARKTYVGTWIDSMTSQMWQYTGSIDATGKILTLEAEGPSHDGPGKVARFRESIEVKGPDHKVFTSKIERDGAWVTLVTIHYRRRK